MGEPQTLPQYFVTKAKQLGESKVAIRQKEFGIWQEFTWQQSYEQTRDFGLGLIALGLERSQHLCSIGDNDREYLWSYLGAQAMGATVIGMYTDAIPTEMEYIITHSDSVLALAKDQEQCDKFLELKDKIPLVKKVIYWDDRGLWDYDDDWLISFEEVQEMGRQLHAKEPNRFEKEVAKGQATDIATLCYTSGTTGNPKGVMLSHGNMIATTMGSLHYDARYEDDNYVSFTPMGWIAEPAFGIAPHTITGMIMNFPEEPETVRENIREIAPENLFYSARLWEGLVGTVQVRMKDATWLNRKLYDYFLPIGYKVADKKFNKEAVPAGLNMMYQIGEALVFRPLRDQLGMSRLRNAYTGGAVLSPDHIRFFHALGINLRQIYASTEMTGGGTFHQTGDVKFASVGKPLHGVQIRVSDNGELQVGGPTIMQGYYKNDEATEKDMLHEDGVRWFCTGDAGYIDDDGHVIFQDRVKNMLRLKNGEVFSPQFIEGRLKFSPYVKDVMAVGDPSRDFVTAMVIMDFDNVGHWAESHGLGYTTFTDLSQKQEVYDLVKQAVDDVNETLPEKARIRYFVLMHKEFDADEAEMTRSRKLKRSVLAEKYGEIVEAMYAGQKAIKMRATVKYQDGSEGFVETDVKVMAV